MIEPYQAIGLVPTMRGIRRRADIAVNLEHISHLIKAASWLSSLDLPVRLIAIPEGALQGFNDEVLDLDHETFARECAIDVPGPETDYLGKLARQWNTFLMAQAKARHPEFPGRFFNVGFVLDPDGDIVLKHHKVVPLLPVEHSVTPHNVWDKWIELYGRTLDAFYPVADTAIGRLGFDPSSPALPVRHYHALTSALPSLSLVPSTPVEHARVIKSDLEIACLRQSARYCEAGVGAALAAVREGATDNEVAAAASAAILAAGSEYLTIDPIVTTGHRSGIAHTTFHRQRIGPGDAVLLEMAGSHRRYPGALMRTAVIGPPSDLARRMYDACNEGLDRAIALMKPGVRGRDVHQACQQVIDEAGFERNFRKRLGYSVGVAFAAEYFAGFTTVFFTLSGYLICSRTLTEVGRSGSFGVRDFFERRIRRLAPAAIFCILAVVVFTEKLWRYGRPFAQAARAPARIPVRGGATPCAPSH